MDAESFAIIIPARYASIRFPAKPLAPLRGSTGVSKTLIQRSWECARSVEGSVGVWVATDDERIADEVRSFGGDVVMKQGHTHMMEIILDRAAHATRRWRNPYAPGKSRYLWGLRHFHCLRHVSVPRQ